ncbi:MAG: NAD-dependent epimerase/dehydratase family protein [Caldilineaceae bacterium]|nr:NAD-dependent epimerase/dehydratase family protein [Caldilineaceae bacterium]
MNVLVTGSSGLIGSEAVLHYERQGHTVLGIDNNFRKVFFGQMGDTTWNLNRLRKNTRRFTHFDLDIRDREAMYGLFQRHAIDLVIHCAAQPSHDKAKEIPILDFEVNAMGTMNLLEATRLHAPEAPFLLLSTNKVYGDAPNELPLDERETRYDFARAEDYEGIDEHCRIDQSLHSLFGASKVAADVMAQEYGRYFGLKVGVFRGGCLTGSAHSGVQLHGFLSYLVHVAMTGKEYTIFGYKGKQVRDQIHSQDVIRALDAFANAPRPGEVYNLGGGRSNSASILECIALIQERAGRSIQWRYDPQNRVGDHICYFTDMGKFRSHFPDWRLQYPLERIIDEMVEAEQMKHKEPLGQL